MRGKAILPYKVNYTISSLHPKYPSSPKFIYLPQNSIVHSKITQLGSIALSRPPRNPQGIRTVNDEQLEWTKEIDGTLNIRSLETVHIEQAALTYKEINRTLNIGSLVTAHIQHCEDKPYPYEKSSQRAQNLYRYAKVTQRATKLYRNVRRNRKHMQSRIQNCVKILQTFPPKQEAE